MIQPLRQRITGTTNAGTAVDLLLPLVKPGELWRITWLSLANASGETVTVEFGVTDIGGFLQLYAKQSVSDGDAVGVLVDFFALERDRLTARVTGTAKSSTVLFTAAGALMDAVPTPVVVVEAK